MTDKESDDTVNSIVAQLADMANSAKDDKGGKAQGKGKGGNNPPRPTTSRGAFGKATQPPKSPVAGVQPPPPPLPASAKAAEGPPSGGIKSDPPKAGAAPEPKK